MTNQTIEMSHENWVTITSSLRGICGEFHTHMGDNCDLMILAKKIEEAIKNHIYAVIV
jgi:hypothetical protein